MICKLPPATGLLGSHACARPGVKPSPGDPMKKLVTAMMIASTSIAAGAASPADPYIWLEGWTGPKEMAWVEAENAKTLPRLQNDPRYAGFYRDALAIASAEDRIPAPNQLNGRIFNFWRDTAHPQGIWRVTSDADYAKPAPAWTTLLDLDALSKAEGKKWVWKGETCLAPEERLCLLNLSDGGEDAVTLREYDVVTGTFVEGGFHFGTAKQNVTWLDKDTVLIARDWGEGSMTASGYPFIVKAVKRGQKLADAKEVYRGAPGDQVGCYPATMHDAQGNSLSYVYRGTTFFENETWILTDTGAVRVAMPGKASFAGMVDGRVIITTSEAWDSFPAGAVVSVPLGEIEAGGALKPVLIFAPNARQSVSGASVTKSRVIVTITDNVRGRALAFTPTPKGWASKPLALPDNSAISVGSISSRSDIAFVNVAGFLDPNTLWSVDVAKGSAAKVKALPAKFDASKHVVEQFEAVSSDGTKIPYFIVHPKNVPLDGSTPTIMSAYGGFEVSSTPRYLGSLGKMWIERGHSYVLANIRGGGEFGPAWHEAGRKTKRQIIYDDFAAVATDIFARKLSSPAKFGIYGGSNGGLLMGVEFNQHPDLWSAVTIQVPLLDMLRYEQIAAGASWVDEYGSVSVPEEKAFLEKISPYNNIRKGVSYPEPYIWTTTKDDRVGPQHARKFAARLAEYGIPYLFYEDTAGGHSGDADIAQGAKLQALQTTYFAQKLEGPAK
jgi:prolyl oligopeptidase